MRNDGILGRVPLWSTLIYGIKPASKAETFNFFFGYSFILFRPYVFRRNIRRARNCNKYQLDTRPQHSLVDRRQKKRVKPRGTLTGIHQSRLSRVPGQITGFGRLCERPTTADHFFLTHLLLFNVISNQSSHSNKPNFILIVYKREKGTERARERLNTSILLLLHLYIHFITTKFVYYVFFRISRKYVTDFWLLNRYFLFFFCLE